MQYPHRALLFARSPAGFRGLPGAERRRPGWRAWTGPAGPPSLDCMVSQDFRTRSGTAIPAAPLGRAELELALRPFGESRMLPRAAYVEPAVFGWEQRHFFGGGWMCVARSERLPS